MSFLSSLAKQAENLGSRVYDQANTLDNGRTFKQRTPTNNRSVIGQATHSGFTNSVGNLGVKPFILNPAELAIESGRGLAAFATHNNPAAAASMARQQTNFQNSIPGFIAGQGLNAGQALYNLGLKAPILDTFNNHAAAERARVAGLQEFNRTVVGQAVRPAEYGIANLSHANDAQQAQVGLDPNATGAQKYIGDPLMGTIGTIGLAKGGEKVIDKSAPVVADAAAKTADAAKAAAQATAEANKRLVADQGGFIAGPGAKDFQQAQQAGKVFQGPDQLPRFEVSDQGAKLIGQPGYETPLPDILDHPALYAQYPELRNIKVTKVASNTSSFDPATGKIQLGSYSKGQKSTLLHEVQHAIQAQEGFATGGSPKEFTNTAIPKRLQDKKFAQFASTKVLENKLKDAGMKFAANRGALDTINLNHPEVLKRVQEYAAKDPAIADQLARVQSINAELSKYPTAYDKYQRLAGEAEARAVEARANMPDSQRYVNGTQVMASQPLPVMKAEFDTLLQKIKDRTATNAESDRYSILKDQIAVAEGKKGAPNPDRWVADKPIKAPSVVYRGTSKDTGNGLAMFGGGKYTAASRAEAAKYGKVQQLGQEALPKNPLQFRTAADFSQWEHEMARKLGVRRNELYSKDTGVETLVNALGHDGVTIGTGKDLIAVKFSPKSIGQYKPQSTFYNSLDVPKNELIVKHDNSGVINGKSMKAPMPKVIENRLTKGGKAGRQNLSEQTMSQIQGEHAIRSTKALDKASADAAGKLSITKLIDKAHAALAVKPGQIDDSTVALVNQAIDRAETAGKHREAVDLHDSLSEHLVKQGQTIQAASLLYRLSPQGMYFKAMRDLKKANGSDYKLPPKLDKQLKDLSNEIKAAKPGDAKDYAKAKFQKVVADNMPKGTADSAIAVWKAGLLSGVKTQGGNFASNATFAALHGLSNPMATAIDTVLSEVGKTKLGKKVGLTGERTKTLTTRGYAGGAVEGTKKGGGTMRSGIDTRNLGAGKFDVHGELNFKSPVIQKVFGTPSNYVFRAMSAADQPFYFAAFRNNLHDIAKAEGINQGFTGPKLDQFVKKTVANPTTKMAETAKLAAQKSVLSEDNKLASAFTKFSTVHPSVQILAPFVKVPTNFLARTLDFTPVGHIKALVSAAKSLKKGQGLDQRQFAEAIGEATTGTALIYIGAELANHNLLSGQYPSGDQKETARWKAEGIQPNSIKIGGTWISLNYLGPVGMLLGAGKDYHDAAARGDNGAIASIAGVAKNLEGQSFLTGLSGFSNAINDPQRSAKSFLNSEVGSVVPTWMADIANSTDSKQRETNTPIQGAQARVPYLRNKLTGKQDVYGNDLGQRTDPLNLFANPLRPSNTRTNDVIGEVSRLHYVDPNNSDLQVTPTPVNKSLKVEGQTYKLNDQQRHDLQHAIGQLTQQQWGDAIKSPQYQKLDDVGKAAMLENIRKTATELAQRNYVTQNNIASYTKPASRKAVAMATGNLDLNSFIKSASGSGSQVSINSNLDPTSKNVLTTYNGMSTADRTKYFNSNNSAQYQYLQAKYQNDKANGTLDLVGDARAKVALAKAKVGSNYPYQVRELYGLNKSELYGIVSSNKDGQKLANEVVAYGDALKAAGVASYNKFRDSKGNVAIRPKAKGSGGSKGSKKKSTTSMIAAVSSASKAAAAAKVNTKASFANKVASAGPKLQAYRKASIGPSKVVVKKQTIRSLA